MENKTPFYVLNHSVAFTCLQNSCENEQYSWQSNCYAKPPKNAQQPFHSLHIGSDRIALSPPMLGLVPAADMLLPTCNNLHLPPVDHTVSLQCPQQGPIVLPEQAADVAAYLDYEVDRMSGFVTEMVQGIVYPGLSVPPQFRKYVLQILSATRLPSSTILLGLYYLSCRVCMLSAAKVYTTGSGQVYRMLTVALLLGSKFLDDNTFQNKSWAKASNIPVNDLNSMELEWLFAFEWKIHSHIYDQEDGFALWLSYWEMWRVKSSIEIREPQHLLALSDTYISRSNPDSKPLLSIKDPISPQYQPNTQYENSWLGSSTSGYSLLSILHSEPMTADYALVPWTYSDPQYYSSISTYHINRTCPLLLWRPLFYRHTCYYGSHYQTVVGQLVMMSPAFAVERPSVAFFQ